MALHCQLRLGLLQLRLGSLQRRFAPLQLRATDEVLVFELFAALEIRGRQVPVGRRPEKPAWTRPGP